MQTNRLAEILKRGDVALGWANTLPAQGIIEIMGKGWDFVWIDGQHGQYAYNDLLHAVRTADSVGVPSLVRVPGHESGILGPCADLAPSAIMVPMVNTQEEAQAVVNALRFAPLGTRSYGGRRVIDLNGPNYYLECELVVIAQIETLQALQELEGIVSTPGIDGIFFGAADVRVQMGVPIGIEITDNEELTGHMRRIAEVAEGAGKFAGCVAAKPEQIRVALDLKYRLISAASDVGFLRAAGPEHLAHMRDLVAQA